MHTVVETSAYLAEAKAVGMTAGEREAAVTVVAESPETGDIMQGTGGCRKFRLAGRGKGKSGGYRVVTAYGGLGYPVFLLTVFGKNEKDNLAKAEKNELAKLTKRLFETYASTKGTKR